MMPCGVFPHQTTYFGSFTPVETGTIPQAISDFISRCHAHAANPAVGFEDFGKVTTNGWRIEADDGCGYEICGAPLFALDDEVSFSLCGRSPYQAGDMVRGMVVSHRPFGAFVRLDAITEALLKIVDMGDSDQRLTEADFPAEGSMVDATVLIAGIADGISQVAISTKRSALGEDE